MEKTKILLAAVFSQKSALVKSIVPAVSLLIFWGILGCAGMHVRDSVPQDAAKGYVKFYYLRSEENNPTSISVYSTDNMDASPYARNIYGVPIGWTAEGGFMKDLFTTDNERGLLVAKKPGNYKFMVTVYGIKEPKVFKILVQEGMVVPIKFSFRDVKKYTSYASRSSTTTTTFTMEMVIEESVPYTEDKFKK